MALKDKLVTQRSKRPKKFKKTSYSEVDLAYMSSLSAAALQRSSKSLQYTLWIISTVIILFLIWANFADLDEITRGSGKVIPSSQVQVVQNLEGGIINEILVNEGDIVKANQPLLRISDIGFNSSFQENRLRYLELKAKVARLEAESQLTEFMPDPEVAQQAPNLMNQEESLYRTDILQLDSTINSLKEKISQRQVELDEAKAKQEQLTQSYQLVKQELDMTTPLVKRGVVSEVELLQLKREANSVFGELRSVEISIPRIQSTIEESRKRLEEAELEFRNKAKRELNEARAEIGILQSKQTAIEDKVERATVRSPVEGTVKRIMINTIGGVVQPGQDLVEIVPLQDKLIAEIKIKPQDIAYLHPDQKAVLKFSAYDFAVHGGLEGKLFYISPDTITDENGDNFFTVRIKTEQNFIESQGKKLDIIVGMTVDADIITGKKTILDYLLKPILKTQQNALRER